MKKDLDQALEAAVEPTEQFALEEKPEDKEKKKAPQSSDLQELRDFLDCL